jgi:hypothetical protein
MTSIKQIEDMINEGIKEFGFEDPTLLAWLSDRKCIEEIIDDFQKEIQEAINKYANIEQKSMCSRDIIVLEELKQKLSEEKRNRKNNRKG